MPKTGRCPARLGCVRLRPIADIPCTGHHGAVLRRSAASILALAALQGSATSAASNSGFQPTITGPPAGIIDFLGRRKECADWAPEPGEVLPEPPAGSRLEWLRCATLPAEEQELRRRYAGDTGAMTFLDQAPGDFRSNTIIVTTNDGPPLARVEHAEQRGLDASGRIPWQIVLDRQAAGGGDTEVTVSWGSYPARTIYLDNQLFPELDITSALVAIMERPYEALNIELRYGFVRGWCGYVEGDDRSRVAMIFRPASVEVSRHDRTNCNAGYEQVAPSSLVSPPARHR